jgi:riboflavin transporter FmnP
MRAEWSIISFLYRTVAAAMVGGLSYLFVRSALRPNELILSGSTIGAYENLLAIGIAVIISVAVFWRLMRGSKVRDEVRKILDVEDGF